MPNLLSISIDMPILDISSKWNHMIYIYFILWMASLFNERLGCLQFLLTLNNAIMQLLSFVAGYSLVIFQDPTKWQLLCEIFLHLSQSLTFPYLHPIRLTKHSAWIFNRSESSEVIGCLLPIIYFQISSVKWNMFL